MFKKEKPVKPNEYQVRLSINLKTSTFHDPYPHLFVAKIWGCRDQHIDVKALWTIPLALTLAEISLFNSGSDLSMIMVIYTLSRETHSSFSHIMSMR